MATPSEAPERARKRQKRNKPSRGTKLPALPENAKIDKRPLIRPPIPSPHANAQTQKVIYVGSKTPFMSAVKRAEKLLRLSDKRLVQSATRIAQNDSRKKRRRGGEDDEISAIAEVVEEQKRSGKRKRGADDEEGNVAAEEIVLKGTGKAIPKVMELGLWFQQRAEEYNVRLRTGSTSSIDDIEYEVPVPPGEGDGGSERPNVMETDDPQQQKSEEVETDIVEETRIRKLCIVHIDTTNKRSDLLPAAARLQRAQSEASSAALVGRRSAPPPPRRQRRGGPSRLGGI